MFAAIALAFVSMPELHKPTRDLWQHLASLRALLADLDNPANPFVPTAEGSRHFNPYWVSLAWIVREFGGSEWSALYLGAFVSLATVGAGIFMAGRAFYRHPWGPLVLLATMLFGWTIPLNLTGFHSFQTLLEGAAYPAIFLVGLSLILWGLAIEAIEKPRLAYWGAPLAALMFASHQLGALIGFMGAAIFAWFWPGACARGRFVFICGLIVGIGASTLWPYYNPVRAVVAVGNPSWVSQSDFYTSPYVFLAMFPALLGMWGLARPVVPHSSRALLIALLAYLLCYLTGWVGIMTAQRFLMPIMLILHVGLGSLVIHTLKGQLFTSELSRKVIVGLAFAAIVFQAAMTVQNVQSINLKQARFGSVHDDAQALTWDIPDNEPIAAYDVAVWPVVAVGQKALSIPWPEPLIHDLDARQSVNDMLFSPNLSRDQRVALARRSGVRILIIDVRYAFRRQPAPQLVALLRSQSKSVRVSFPMIRFDL